jgi:hypothetical protein
VADEKQDCFSRGILAVSTYHKFKNMDTESFVLFSL